jgi:hypothetical protein
MEGNARGLILMSFRHLPGGTEENDEEISVRITALLSEI